jgi:hypothetical protein
MAEELEALHIVKRTGRERFHIGTTDTPLTLLGFRQWSSSDLVGTALRGILAEYIVACALDLERGTRVEWDAVDLRTPEGLRVEVKSGAYLQPWKHHRLSAIGYDVRPTFGWDATTNQSSTERRRQADVYVFCLLHHTDKQTIDPLDLAQWTFCVLPSRVLDERNRPVSERAVRRVRSVRSASRRHFAAEARNVRRPEGRPVTDAR